MKAFQVFVVVIATTLHCSAAGSLKDDLPSKPQFRHHHPDGLRLCVPDRLLPYCSQMTEALEGIVLARHDHATNKIQCVSAPDKIACIDRIIRGDADWTIVDPEELYVAYRFLPENGVIVTSEIRSAEYSDRDYRYAPVAVIRSAAGIKTISDLRGKKSCHTGFGKNSGWKVPFARLFTKGELKCTNDTLNAAEKDLATVADYFGGACLPGQWVPTQSTDKLLKTKYSQLCQLCKDPKSCSSQDSHAGYDGALRCLTENNGDVAWTKFDAVRDFFKLNETTPLEITDQYSLLCRDGSKVPLTSDNPCSWAKRPWRTIVTTNHFANNLTLIEDLQNLVKELQKKAQSSTPVPEWLTMVLDFYKPTDVAFHYPPNKVKTLTPQAYLRPTNFAETFWHPSCGITEKSLKICVFNQVELQKCNLLKLATLGQRISPGFSCVLGTCAGHCSYLVSKGDADLVLADAAAAYKIQNSTRLPTPLIPILTELEATNEDGVTLTSRYALAVIRSEISGEFTDSLKPLKGKRSCHGSIKSIAGWNVPLSVLRDEKEITEENNCALPIELSKYFSKSCVPGALDAQRDYPLTPSTQLCSLCAGDAPSGSNTPLNRETVCADSSLERYQGSSGALRCLEDNVGDVAFIDHVALLSKLRTTGTKDALANIQLLCRNGSVANVENFRSCNWGMVTPNRILARAGEKDTILRENALLSLLRAQEIFRPGGKQENVFKLFGSYYGTRNVIFQSGAVGLQTELPEAEREQENKVIRDFNSCKVPYSPHPGIHSRSDTDGEWKPKESI